MNPTENANVRHAAMADMDEDLATLFIDIDLSTDVETEDEDFFEAARMYLPERD